MNIEQKKELQQATINSYITSITYNSESYRVAPLVFGYNSSNQLILQGHVFYKGNDGKITPLIFNSNSHLQIFDCTKITYVESNLDSPISFRHEIVDLLVPISSFSTMEF